MKLTKNLEKSRRILLDCCLPNGAIVAANSSNAHYPKEAKDYRFVWLRDSAYVCMALDALGLKEPQERFFRWCMKAEGFKEDGVFLENYFPNGKINRYKSREGKTTRWGVNFQPDQAGIVLFEVWNHFKEKLDSAKKYSELVELAAEGLCNLWDRTHFKIITQDLWEGRFTFPDLEDNFTYTLAACSKGLECAHRMLPNKEWLKASREMKKRLDLHHRGYFYRSFGKLPDSGIDGSALALVYPFEVYRPDDRRMVSTVKEIEKRLVKNYGVYRFECDDYDGWMYKGVHRGKGGGAWPILNFLIAIYYSKLGDKTRAKRYFDFVTENACPYVPEQIFSNDLQKCPAPLAWSQAMFVLACKEMGLKTE
ncbi:MAG: glycoside hydrolase family 15 protein [Candidatus Altiarchaeota archaeon]|nr:glycoside hydrolase family 15 protein [Candidatus Altiarchaeota archaeon]